MSKNQETPGNSRVRILNVDISGDFEEPIREAADILLSGELVAYPTESFYGLAADPMNEIALRRLFEVKRRQPDLPILILIPSQHMVEQYVKDIPPIAQRLMEEYWPGGLTLVFQAAPSISPLLTGYTGKIGIRLSSHPVATALARAVGGPISGTSANISHTPPCRNAREVLRSLGDGLALILDGGETAGEVGSTVLDVTVDPPRVLRKGLVEISPGMTKRRT